MLNLTANGVGGAILKIKVNMIKNDIARILENIKHEAKWSVRICRPYTKALHTSLRKTATFKHHGLKADPFFFEQKEKAPIWPTS